MDPVRALPLILIFLFGAALFTSCEGTKTLEYTTNYCNPSTAFVQNMIVDGETEFDPGQKYNSGADWTAFNLDATFKRQFRIPVPPTDDLTLAFYNNSPLPYYLRVFAVRTETEFLLIHPPSQHTKVFEEVPVSVDIDNNYNYLIVEVRYSPLELIGNRSNDYFISLAAYDQPPATVTNYDKLRRPRGCDNQPQCFVIGSCNRDENLEKWAKSLGLTVVRRENSTVTNLVNACATSVAFNRNDPAGEVGEIRRDTLNGDVFIERDFNFTIRPVVSESFLTVIRQQDNEVVYDYEIVKQDGLLGEEDCQEYQPRNGSGSGPMVTIIDTGVRDLGGGLTPWADYAVTTDLPPYLSAGSLGYDFFDGDTDPNESVYHGTSVAGALIGGYRGGQRLTVVHHKIADYSQSSYFGAIEAIYAAVDHNTDIIILSWGISQEQEPRGLKCALEYAMEREVMVFTSSGNDLYNLGTDPQWPAAFTRDPAFKTLYTVGSYEPKDLTDFDEPRLAHYSNFGQEYVDVYGYWKALVPNYAGTDTEYAKGTSVSVPLVVRNLLNRMSSPPEPEIRDFDAVFFPSGLKDGKNQTVTPHPVKWVPLICPGDA